MFTEMKKTTRRYVLKARGEQMAETRARIVEAIMRLHGEVGPRKTTVSAIAQRAGVERLTVYRHFRDEASMFAACSHRYLELNPPPDPSAWGSEIDPVRRTRRGLDDLYAFFGRTASMFEKAYRDAGEYVPLKNIMDQFDSYLRNLADGLAAAWPRNQADARRHVILRHAVKFTTWQSLESDGVDNDQKIALILQWLGCSKIGE
jgi:AcrR family transcriptional regulator